MPGTDFIQDLAVVMLIAGLVGWTCQRIGLPMVVGYLLAGLVIGPYTPPFAFVTDIDRVQTLSQIGLVFLMFSIGLGFSLRRLRRLGLSLVVATVIGALLVFNGCRLLGLLLGWSEIESLFLAGILVVSSSAIIGKVLQEIGATHEKAGQTALGVTVMEDIIAVVALTLLGSIIHLGTDGQGGALLEVLGVLGAFVLLLGVAGLIVIPRFLNKISRSAAMEVQTILVAGLLFSMAILAVKAGYSLALGAFLLGAIVAETPQKSEIAHAFQGVRDIFTAVFFVAIGMMIDLQLLVNVLPLVFLVAFLTLLGRTIACGVGLLLIGHSLKDAIRAGVSLTPIGEFSFIIAQMGVMAAAVPPTFYPLAVGVSVVTTFLAPFLIRRSAKISHLVERYAPKVAKDVLAIYQRYLQRSMSFSQKTLFWKLTSKRFLQIGVEVALISGLLVFSRPLYDLTVSHFGKDLLVTDGTVFVFWSLMGLVLLAPLVAVWRNVSALSLVLSEMARKTFKINRFLVRFLETLLKASAGTVLGLWLWTLLPFGLSLVYVALAVVLVVGLFAVVYRRDLIRFHSELEVEVGSVLEASAQRKEGTLPPWLDTDGAWDLNLEEVVLPNHTVCGGKRLRDLDLRKRFGCSVVGVDRQGYFIGNPGPDLYLYPRDRLLLTGSAGALQAVRDFLYSRVEDAGDDGLRFLDDVRMETVVVSPDSPRLDQKLVDLGIVRETGVQIAGIKRAGQHRFNPESDEVLRSSDELLVLGTPDQVRKFRLWLEPNLDENEGEHVAEASD